MSYSNGNGNGTKPKAKNVLGGELKSCSTNPLTGFFRDGCCNTNATDYGSHTICALMTDEFLEFSKSRGNDLSTPRPEYDFAGLNAGDQWCLCAARWREAYEAGAAPLVNLEATHEQALQIVTLMQLKEFSSKPD